MNIRPTCYICDKKMLAPCKNAPSVLRFLCGACYIRLTLSPEVAALDPKTTEIETFLRVAVVPLRRLKEEFANAKDKPAIS